MITSYFKSKKRAGPQCHAANPDTVEESMDTSKKHELDDNSAMRDGFNKRFKRSDESTLPHIELISHLKDESWRNEISNYISSSSFHKLAKFVAVQR